MSTTAFAKYLDIKATRDQQVRKIKFRTHGEILAEVKQSIGGDELYIVYLVTRSPDEIEVDILLNKSVKNSVILPYQEVMMRVDYQQEIDDKPWHHYGAISAYAVPARTSEVYAVSMTFMRTEHNLLVVMRQSTSGDYPENI